MKFPEMYPELHDSGYGGPVHLKTVVLQKLPSTNDGPVRALKKVRRAVVFPVQLLVWGAMAALMYATLGLDIVSEKLEEWE
jgi:hypothetical protein